MNFKQISKVCTLLFAALFLSNCGGGSSSSGAVESKRAGVNEVIVHIGYSF